MPAQRAAPINFTPQASPTDEVHYFSLVGSSAIHRRSAAYWEALGVGPRPKMTMLVENFCLVRALPKQKPV
jgi:hypothetical protein